MPTADEMFAQLTAKADPLATDPNAFDPFKGTEQQTTQRYRAVAKVTMGAVVAVASAPIVVPPADLQDLAATSEPHLISLRIHVGGGQPTNAVVELDDRDASLDIPALGQNMHVELGWASDPNLVTVFDGYIQEIEHTGGRRQGGRRMHVKGLGANFHPGSHLKQRFKQSLGDGPPAGQEEGHGIPFQTWASKVAGIAGATATVSKSLLDQRYGRDKWEQNNQSALEVLGDLAQQFGAELHVTDGNHIFILRSGDGPVPPSGSPTSEAGTVDLMAKWGDNLISWAVTPYSAQAAWGGAYQTYFDSKQGEWAYLVQKFPSPVPGGGDALYQLPMPAPNKTVADQWNGGAEAFTQYAGNGRIMINGEPGAVLFGTITLEGARPGVDGVYRIMGIQHDYSRQGFTTTIETKLRLSGPPATFDQRFTFGPSAPGNLSNPNAPANLQPGDTTTPTTETPQGDVIIGPITIEGGN